ncbi:hypothetical protein [Streptomyces triculaminicus]|uniref:hypothetical protein n=1 Tax=Streptomyces triculaminicus TaxID=2816232 RepID=UPI0037D71AC0
MEEEEQTPVRPPWGAWFKTIAGVVAPTTLVTGLLLYFGFAYVDSRYQYFGIDAATLGLSTQDYLLRSAGPLFMPVGTALMVGLLGALGYTAVSVLSTSRPRLAPVLTWLSLGLVGCGVALFVVGVLAGYEVWHAGLLDTPLILCSGLLLVLYGRLLYLRSTGRMGYGRRELTALAFVAALISLCLFWTVQAYAQLQGRSDARYLARNLGLRPEIVLDTTERLHFTGSGVREEVLPSAPGVAQRFRYRYHGLRLLAQVDNRMFVIPQGWDRSRGDVLIVPADANARVAFRPG